MSKIKNVLSILFVLFVLASCGSGVEEKLHGKWVLKELKEFDEEQSQRMGAGDVYLELKENGDLKAKWYGVDDPFNFVEEEGTWLFNEMEVDGGIGDLILQFESGNEIMIVNEVTDSKLVLRTNDGSTNDFIFEKE